MAERLRLPAVLVTNLTAAKPLGLQIPDKLLALANKVIEWMAFCCSALGRYWHFSAVRGCPPNNSPYRRQSGHTSRWAGRSRVDAIRPFLST
jgi:hypothetical protein